MEGLRTLVEYMELVAQSRGYKTYKDYKNSVGDIGKQILLKAKVLKMYNDYVEIRLNDSAGHELEKAREIIWKE